MVQLHDACTVQDLHMTLEHESQSNRQILYNKKKQPPAELRRPIDHTRTIM